MVVPRDEEEVVAGHRVQRRFQRRLSGIGDGTRRKALDDVRIVRMRHREIGLVDVVVPLVVVREQQRVDHRRVGLQAHPLLQTVVEDAGDPRALVGPAGLLLDDAGERYRLELVEADGGQALHLRMLPGLAEP